jgi:two-component system invasion response regulator UvrY
MPAILIFGHDLLARHGLKHLLNQEFRSLVFGDSTTPAQTLDCLSRRTWDLVVIVLSNPESQGLKLLAHVRRSYPDTRVMILSSHADAHDAIRARELRASGYLVTNGRRGELLKAFRAVLNGKSYFVGLPPGKAAEPFEPGCPSLSKRERDVLTAFVAGKRVSEIAAQLSLSAKTVSTYKRRVLNKLQLNSVADMVRYAMKHKFD